MYLIKASDPEKVKGIIGHIPRLDVLDELTHRMVLFGFLFLTVGIITGAVWANSAWGTYWSWDPKETWSLITWFRLCDIAARAPYARLGGKADRLSIYSGVFGSAVHLFRRQFAAGVAQLWKGIVRFYPEMASGGPGLRSRAFAILDVALLRLRSRKLCGLGLNHNLPSLNRNDW